MRTLFALTCYLLLLISATFSQNWRLFDPARKYYYGRVNETVDHMLRIDSFAVAGNDTLWYPSQRHKPDTTGNDSCWFFLEIPSTFGHHIRQQPNGKYHFIYTTGDTLHLDLRATAPWRAFTGHTAAYAGWIDATPLGKSVALTPLGTADSIFTIELKYFWSNGLHDYTAHLKVGKRYGMFHVPLMAPLRNTGGPLADFKWDSTIVLAGISNPDIGIRNIPRDRFFSMQPGDTIQIKSMDYDNGAEVILWTWTQDIYLSRSMSPGGDTIYFQIDRSEFYAAHNRPVPTPYRTIVYEMVPIGTSMYQRLDRDLGETWPADEDASAWAWDWRLDGSFPDRIMKPLNTSEPYDTVLQCHRSSNGDLFDPYYMDGLGGPYYSFYYPSFYEGYRRPFYFRLGGVAQGTPVAFAPHTPVDTPRDGSSFQIYPNPCSDQFLLDLSAWVGSEPVQLEVFSLQGQKVRHSSAEAGHITQHSMKGLPKGIYFLRASSGDYSHTQKLILQ